MKYLVLFAVVAVLWWSWRQRGQRPGRREEIARPVERMVSCRQCGVNLPETEALTGNHGVYCCPAHRNAAESGRP